MGIRGLELIGGQMVFQNMNTTMTTEEYAVSKVFMWFHSLQDNKIPTRWFKAGKKGTTVNYDVPKTSDDIEESFIKLKKYMEKVNEMYDLDLTISEKTTEELQ